MKQQTADDERHCGNCERHNPFEYPERALCGKRLEEGMDPIVETLWCCNWWISANQECFCVREAMAKKK